MYKQTYTSDGVTTEFNFGPEIKWFQAADIKVAINNELLSVSQYAVQTVILDPEYETPEQEAANSMGILANFGGKVILAASPISGAQIDIFRKISLERQICYQLLDRIQPSHLNTDFDFILECMKDFHSESENIS